MRRQLQWVALAGGDCVFATISASLLRATASKLLPRGRSSKSAFTPPSTYRARQSTIVGRDVFSSLAKALLDRPSAAPRIIRARSAWRCSVLPERTILSSSALSSAVIASAVLLAHMPHSIAGPNYIVKLCVRHYTSDPVLCLGLDGPAHVGEVAPHLLAHGAAYLLRQCGQGLASGSSAAFKGAVIGIK